jgi:hypothetical protein
VLRTGAWRRPPLRPGSPLRALLAGVALLLAPGLGRGAQATVSWDPDTAATVVGYHLYYDRDPGAPYEGTDANEGPSPLDVPVAGLADPTHPSVLVTGLDSCVPYYFAVSSYDATSESQLSPEATAVLVGAPADVTLTVTGPQAFRVTWAHPGDGDEGPILTYRVHYDTDSGEPYAGTGADQGDSPVTVTAASLFDPLHPRLDLTGLPAGQPIFVAVESVCEDGTAKLGAEVTAGSAGTEDAGTGADAGDGGEAPPADGAPGGEVVIDGGPVHIKAGVCGCRAVGSAPGGEAAAVLVLALALAGARRRGWGRVGRAQRASRATWGRRNCTRCASRSPCPARRPSTSS